MSTTPHWVYPSLCEQHCPSLSVTVYAHTLYEVRVDRIGVGSAMADKRTAEFVATVLQQEHPEGWSERNRLADDAAAWAFGRDDLYEIDLPTLYLMWAAERDSKERR